MPAINLNSQVLTNVALSANSLTVTGALSTSTYGNFAEQGIRNLRNFRRFRLNSLSNSGGASIAFGGINGVSLTSGNGATSYAVAGWTGAYFTQTANSGGGISFDNPIGFGTIGLLHSGLINVAGFGYRFIVGDPNSGSGVPANSISLPLADKGFGWSLISNGTNLQYSLFAHTGTTYLSSTPVTFTGFDSLNRISQWWVKSNKNTNQIELYISTPSADFGLLPTLPSTPTATLNATINGSSAGRFITANIITNGTTNPGNVNGALLTTDEVLFTVGV